MLYFWFYFHWWFGVVLQDMYHLILFAWRRWIFILFVVLLLCILVFPNPCPTSLEPDLYNTTEPEEDVIGRNVWKAHPPRNIKYFTDTPFIVILKHTGGKTCNNFKTCVQRVQEIQKNHMKIKGYPDIAYNFLVGGDGRIYVGRDWAVQNDGFQDYNRDSIDIAFIGNFSVEKPTEDMLRNAQKLIVQGAGTGDLDYGNLVIVCHNQTEVTDSPGENIYREVQNWTFCNGSTLRAILL